MLVKDLIDWIDAEDARVLENCIGEFFDGYRDALDKVRIKALELFQTGCLVDEKECRRRVIQYVQEFLLAKTGKTEGRKPKATLSLRPLSREHTESRPTMNCEKHGRQPMYVTKNGNGYCIKCWEGQMTIGASMAPAGYYDKNGNPVLTSFDFVEPKKEKEDVPKEVEKEVIVDCKIHGKHKGIVKDGNSFCVECWPDLK